MVVITDLQCLAIVCMEKKKKGASAVCSVQNAEYRVQSAECIEEACSDA